MKRSNKKTKCANPLFEQWLEEWKEEAAARDSPLQHSFGKALNSLRKFPITLESGRECNILEHFGPKICLMLDKQLDRYRKIHNLPANASQSFCYVDEIKEKKKKKAQPPDNNLPSTSGLNDFNSVNNSLSNDEDKVPKNQNRKTANKPYIPKVGSGAYALLVTLYKHTKEGENKPDFMLKKDLISESKFYSDAPMKSTAIEHYSGWSSMSTLIEKNLVKKKSNPAKYSLTDAGYALALQLIESPSAQDDNDYASASKNDKNSRSASSHSSYETSPISNNSHSLSKKTKNSAICSEVKSSDVYSTSKSKSSPTFSEKYCDFLKSPEMKTSDEAKSSDVHSTSKSNSKPTFSEKYCDFLKSPEIKTIDEVKSSDVYSTFKSHSKPTFSEKYCDFLKSPEMKSNRIVNSNSSCESKLSKSIPSINQKDDDIIVLDDDEDDDVFENPPTKHDDINTPNDFENIENDQEFEVFCNENVESLTPVKKQSNVLYSILDCPSSSTNQQKTDENIDLPIRSVSSSTKAQFLSPLPSTSTESYKRNIDFDKLEIGDVGATIVNKPECSTTKKKAIVPDKIPKLTTTTKTGNRKKTTSVDTPTEMFYLLPNNFDIILLVDTQETSGGKTRPKDDATISELSALQTVFEIRSLKVGDFAWIARCRFTNKELALPFIVERKRIDDLASSIRDGRYHEQKFRLRQSGIKNVIYLIENYGTTYHGCIPITSLFQAAVNSLIQDNFQVKFTKDHKDSMSYLATITKMLTEMYESKELVSCRKKDIEVTNSNCLNGAEPLMEFSEFNKSSMKTKNFKVKEMLIRQLVQLKGLSVDKAIAITDFYPTPKVLSKALKNSDEKLLANIEAGSSKHKIGPAISKTIWQFYTQHNFA